MKPVPFSGRRLGWIAVNTVREAVRQRLFWALLLAAAGLLAGVRFFGAFHFGSGELKFIVDFGFGALALGGALLAVAAATQLFFSELEHGTVHTLLAKPVWRAEFVLGKLLGVWVVVGLFCATLTLLIVGWLWWRETTLAASWPEAFAAGRPVRHGLVLVAGALQWLKLGVLVAYTVLIASYARTPLFTFTAGLAVLVIAHLRHLALELAATGDGGPARWLIEGGARLFPNFQLFNLGEFLIGDAAGPALGWSTVAGIVGYGVAYLGVVAGLAVLSFRGREL
jgi:ABC-type transport system involved in multi-copper enzyme maturation permease subunit